METVIGYLKKTLNDEGDFLKEYKRLSVEDREQMKEYAKEEMTAKGIQYDEPKHKDK